MPKTMSYPENKLILCTSVSIKHKQQGYDK